MSENGYLLNIKVFAPFFYSFRLTTFICFMVLLFRIYRGYIALLNIFQYVCIDIISEISLPETPEEITINPKNHFYE